VGYCRIQQPNAKPKPDNQKILCYLFLNIFQELLRFSIGIFSLEIMMFDPDTLSALSADKVDKYLRHIELPHRYWPQNSPTLNSDLLSALQAYHLSTIPYENLALHYAKDVYISLDVNVIYQKFVDKKRGGYCMENNIFFYHLLRFFGFKVYLTGARLHRTGDGQPAGWTGW
jgi:hypothetical protein